MEAVRRDAASRPREGSIRRGQARQRACHDQALAVASREPRSGFLFLFLFFVCLFVSSSSSPPSSSPSPSPSFCFFVFFGFASFFFVVCCLLFVCLLVCLSCAA